MIAAHELVVTEPAFALVCLLAGALVALVCRLHREQARERHAERKNGGL